MRPRVTLAYAQSADGRIATKTGDSQWISGSETLTLAHELRNEHDGILAGIGTVIADNPQLTCRIEGGSNPHRIILDSRLRTPVDSHIVQQASNVPTTVVCGREAPAQTEQRFRDSGVSVMRVDSDDTGLDLHEILRQLGEMSIESLMIEGGSGVMTSFLRERLVDRVILVSAPLFIGEGTNAIGDLGTTMLAKAIRGRTQSVRQAGDDIVWEFILDAS